MLGKWKWHLGPFIQLKQGSCTLLEWAKWRTYSLGSRFLSKLLETWCSTWPYFVKKLPKIGRDVHIPAVFFPAALAAVSHSVLQISSNMLFVARSHSHQSHSTPPLPDSNCGTQKLYVHGCLFCFEPISACLDMLLTEGASLLISIITMTLWVFCPFLLTRPWNKE